MTRRGRLLAAAGGLVLLGAVAAGALMWRPAMAPVADAGPFPRALVEAGARVATLGDCAVCHAGPGGGYAGGRAVQTPFGAVYASNITPDRQFGIGTWSEAAFVRSMRDGVDREGRFLYPAFPYNHYTRMTDDDLRALYAFVMTRAPVSAAAPETRLPFPFGIRPLMAGWNLLFLDRGTMPADPQRSAEWNHGRYLVESLGHCGACHTPRNALGAEQRDRAYQGGLADGWDAPGLTAATSPAAIPWTAEALFNYLRHGIDDGHAAAAGPMHAVSHNLSTVPAADVRAMATYVASMTGGDRAGEVGNREAAVLARVRALGPPPATLASTEGAAIFAGACAQCHGAGAPMMLDGRPSLSLGSSVTAVSPRNAINTVLYGLQPLPGRRGPWMPGFADTLTAPQIGAVVEYLRARFTDRPGWTGLADTVSAIRRESGS